MKSFRFPHPLVLLTLFIILAAGLSCVLPAGEFARRPNAATGREVVVPGSYHRVPPTPVAPLAVAVAVAVPQGLAAASALCFGVDWLLVHGRTGAKRP